MFKNLFRKKFKVEIYFKSGLVARGVFYKFSIKTNGYEITSLSWEGTGDWTTMHIDGREVDFIKTRRVWF